MSEHAPQPNNDIQAISDIVAVDSYNRAHAPNGDFLSKSEVEQIATNQDLIRSQDSSLVLDDAERKEIRSGLRDVATGNIPESMTLKRDWSLTKAEHEAAQTALINEKADRLKAHERVSRKLREHDKRVETERQEAEALTATERQKEEERQAEASAWRQRVAEHTEAHDTHIQELANRKDARAAFIDKEFEKARIHNGGERYVQLHEKEIREAAEAKADELFPITEEFTVIEPTDRKARAEASQTSYAAQLKKHDRAGLKAAAKFAENTSQSTIDEEPRDDLDDQLQRDRAALVANVADKGSILFDQDDVDSRLDHSADPDWRWADMQPNPLWQPENEPTTRRRRNLSPSAIAINLQNSINERRERGTSPEHRRRNILIAVGALAVAAAGTVLAVKYGFRSGTSGQGHEAARHLAGPEGPMGPTGVGHNTILAEGPMGPTGSTGGKNGNFTGSLPKGSAPSNGGHEATGATHMHIEHLTADDTIWHHAEEELKKSGDKKPSGVQIWGKTQQILNKNHLTWEQARHLPVGFTFKV